MTFLILLIVTGAFVSFTTANQKNVLLIMADDMRPEIASLKENGDSMFSGIQTPNLDSFAKESLVLTRAYTSQALCCPSRTSIMTGRRPETTQIYINGYWRTEGGNFTSLPQHFKNNGYTSIGMGKIYHPGGISGDDDPLSWSEDYYHASNNDLYTMESKSWIGVPSRRINNYPLPDQELAEYANETLARLAPDAISGVQPFFLALGFYKPHLPFVFPIEYLDLYPEADVDLAENKWVPDDLPDDAWYNYQELLKYNDVSATGATGSFNTSLEDSKALELRRAYYATVSFVDGLIGDVLQSLADNGLADNTIVVFMSDHGFQLGEHADWAKQTNFELSVRTPLMIRIPGETDADTSVVDAREDLVELVDLFPTVVEAAGLDSVDLCPEDSSAIDLCHEGTSLMPLVVNSATEWRDAAFSWHYRENGAKMGYTMRTSSYRYTEWVKFRRNSWTPVWTTLYGSELYDHDVDPEENYNIAANQTYSTIVSELSDRLHNGWRESIPGASIAKRSNEIGAGKKKDEDILMDLMKHYLKSLQ